MKTKQREREKCFCTVAKQDDWKPFYSLEIFFSPVPLTSAHPCSCSFFAADSLLLPSVTHSSGWKANYDKMMGGDSWHKKKLAQSCLILQLFTQPLQGLYILPSWQTGDKARSKLQLDTGLKTYINTGKINFISCHVWTKPGWQWFLLTWQIV